MKRRTFAVLGMALLAMPVSAQSVKLQGYEIRALLTGNTAVGRWQGENYRQFFGDDGVTIYAQKGARSTRGDWRVDDELQEYQSIWPNDAEWEGWFVMEFGGTFYWVSRSTPPTPFEILEGQQLVAE
ncbi:MAG: hypothetical protein MK180_14365 [Rhodobacteraceae bacterium]|nr:hypothetical protein [Paracoccaceae bacterium]